MRQRILATAGVLVLGLGAIGCRALLTDPLGRQNSLEEIQRRYTELIRWGELEKAGVFVHPESKEEFDSVSKAFEGIRLTAYEIGNIHLREENTKASVTVTYRGYAHATLIEKPIREHQEWVREGTSNDWRVRPSLTEFVETLGVAPHRARAPSAPAKAAD